MAFGELRQFCLEVIADLNDVFEQIFPLDGIDHRRCDSAGQRPTAEGRSVHAGMEGARHLVGAECRAHRDAAGKRLGQRGDVRHNAKVLIGAPLSGAAEAGLNLIDDQQSAGGVGQLARLGEELLRERADAAFALNCL